jgi:predicted flap endonuclease-1-like 5' DNA nuclease
MSETGWIIGAVVAVIAIVLAFVVLRRKGLAEVSPPAPVAVTPPPVPVAPVRVAPSPIRAEPHADTTYPQEPLASIIPPIAEVIAAQVAAEPAEIVAPVESVEPVIVSTPPVSAPIPATSPDGDNLLRLKGVGPKIATLLKSEGISRYAQIAAWSDADIAAIDAKLGSFAGRPQRDNWVDQARLLAADDVAGYEAKYGKLS